jgi:uncharacterized protein YodC (DUF2158 family)
MDNQELQIGDVVKLKSGGPALTVTDSQDDAEVMCVWYDGRDFSQRVFPTGALVKVDHTISTRHYLSQDTESTLGELLAHFRKQNREA